MYRPVTANSEISPVSLYEEVRIILFFLQDITIICNIYMIHMY